MKQADITARTIVIRGIVQGVGFRPFVYQLAHRYGIHGEVANTSSGVILHAEAEADMLDVFVEAIGTDPPPLARITDIQSHRAELAGHDDFRIVHSRQESQRATLISPDVSVCDDCRRELMDPADRRYRYPFINCTNCGPRYTIIDDVPYDRPKTSMKHFAMCADCQAEYDDPMDRRFHAQPNACSVCGPHVSLFQNIDTPVAAGDAIQAAADLIRRGNILAVRGLGGFHLVVDALNEAAVQRLRQRKHREEKPFALMAADIDAVSAFADVTGEEAALLSSPQRPIVLVKKRPGHGIAGAVAPRNRYFGVMLPYTPLHYLLMDQGFAALVMTSGNLSEEPICIGNAEAFERLQDIADYFLIHNRDIYLRSDDSILRRAAGSARFIRRSRGYVPVPVVLTSALPPVLGCGAMLKNTVCITRDNHAFVSQHIGDMENAETLAFFEMTIEHLKRILDVTPEIVAHDLHPDYLNTRYAMELDDVTRIGVQHHHAHIVSAMAEHRISGPVIGLSFDGTGLGTDGKAWGGEVLLAEYHRFDRAAHMVYLPMPGSNAAVREPWRMALSYLIHTYGDAFRELALPLYETLSAGHMDTVAAMIRKGINAPETSSLGRLFDGVAAIVGLRRTVRYEGQAAMELEMAAEPGVTDRYDAGWENGDDGILIPFAPVIRSVVDDVIRQAPVGRISARFHNTVIGLFTDLCRHLREESGIDRVVLSGGVFQNRYLLEGFTTALEKHRFSVYSQSLVPANDGGISLGQAVAAAAMASAGA